MIDPIPSGTRDVLPDEMRELRAITEKVRAVFDARGYGEVATPALEYETTLANPYVAAERGYVDAVIAPHETRLEIVRALRLLRSKRETLPAKKHGNIPL